MPTAFDELKAIMIAKKLTCKQVARITDKSIRSVQNWLHTRKKTGKPHRNITQKSLDLLRAYIPGSRI
jgi:transposase